MRYSELPHPLGSKEMTILDESTVPAWKGMLHLVAAIGRWLSVPSLWVCVALLILAARVVVNYVSGSTALTLVEDGVSRQVRTRRTTVGEVIDDLGIVVGEQDHLAPGRDTSLRPQMAIDVRHAHPVTVVADGTRRTWHTHRNAADAILEEAGLALGPHDELWVNGEKLFPGQRSEFPEVTPARSESSRGGRSRGTVAPVAHVEVRRATPIHVSDGGEEQLLYTTAKTVGQALREAGVPLYLGDRVSPTRDTAISAGVHVRVSRGRLVVVAADGRTLRTRTQASNVAGVLAELGVSLVGGDFAVPSLGSELSDGLHIRVVRLTEETVIWQEEIPFETEWMSDPALELDHRYVADEGAPGITRRRYKVLYHDGQEVERRLEEEWVAQEPRWRKIAYGTRVVIRTLETRDGPIEYWRRIRVFLTAYTAATCGKTPDHPEYGITRLGWQMRHGIIAVDPRVIRMRSQLYVPGYGKGVAGDTGGLIKGRHIDLGYEEDGLVWHYEWGWVYILSPQPPPSQIQWILPDYPRER